MATEKSLLWNGGCIISMQLHWAVSTLWEWYMYGNGDAAWCNDDV